MSVFPLFCIFLLGRENHGVHRLQRFSEAAVDMLKHQRKLNEGHVVQTHCLHRSRPHRPTHPTDFMCYIMGTCFGSNGESINCY